MPRILAGAIGLILIVAGISKATNLASFIDQMGAYGIISDPVLLTLSAWALTALQIALGIALLVFYRPGLILSLTAALWLTLFFATAWAWISGVTQECGCYGPWYTQTPDRATLENLVLLMVTCIALVTLGRPSQRQTTMKRWAVVAACIIGVALPAIFGFRFPALTGQKSEAVTSGLEDRIVQELETIALNQGTYLLVLMNTECSSCWESVPDVDEIATKDDLPSVIGLTANDEFQRTAFIDEFQPQFPLREINEDLFWELLGDGPLPRVLLVKNGRLLHSWDQGVPDETMVRTELFTLAKRQNLS